MLLLTSLAIYGNTGYGDSSSELGRLSRSKWTFDNSLIEVLATKKIIHNWLKKSYYQNNLRLIIKQLVFVIKQLVFVSNAKMDQTPPQNLLFKSYYHYIQKDITLFCESAIFHPKIYLILYPQAWNSTTDIAIPGIAQPNIYKWVSNIIFVI